VTFLNPNLTSISDFALDFVLDFIHLLIVDDKLNGKLLVKRDGLINGFRFGNLDLVFPVKLVV